MLGSQVAISAGILSHTDEVEIGSNTLIGSRVTIIDHDHGDYGFNKNLDEIPEKRQLNAEKIRIGNNCWIGEGAVILKGVKISDGCVVGANTVVTKSFLSPVVIAGVPGKVIKKLDY